MSLVPSPNPYTCIGLVDFGYRVHDSLIPRPPYHQPLPTKPPPAGDPRTDLCGCPACLSGRFYAVSPACRFWRPDCTVCGGHRTYTYRTPGRWRRIRVDCFRCVQEWQDAIAGFYLVLRDPSFAARLLATTASDTASDTATDAASEVPPDSADEGRA